MYNLLSNHLDVAGDGSNHAAFQDIQCGHADALSAFQSESEKTVMDPEDINKEIAHRHSIGNGCGDCSAQNFVSLGEQYEHKQGIQNHDQNSHQGDAEACCFGLPGAADQMCKGR